MVFSAGVGYAIALFLQLPFHYRHIATGFLRLPH